MAINVNGRLREMTARREVEAQDPVSGTQEHEEHRLVRLRARVRLHVGVGGAEELHRAFDGEAFDDVDILAAAVFLQHQAPSQRTGPTHPRCGVLRPGSPRFGSLKPEEDFTTALSNSRGPFLCTGGLT